MASDTEPDDRASADEWRGDFQSAEDRMLEASLAATPAQRLQWLEEALKFAARMGALPKRDED